jgi:hypothetical protein
MDIGALLAEADEEVGYENERFDVEEPAMQRAPSLNETASILKQAAQVVAKEEKDESDRVFADIAASFEKPDGPDLSILVDAAKEVDTYYAEEAPNIIKLSVSDDESVSSEDSEVEEEEGDPELNVQLFIACFHENVSQVRTLLSKGAWHFARDRHGWTPLHWAASRGYNEIIEILVDHRSASKKIVKSYVNAKDLITGWTPLHVILRCILFLFSVRVC